jgi:hypothetical protein
LPRWLDPLPFQLDHIIAEQHGGETVLENLAWCCLHDNKHKGPNIAGIDPVTGQLVPLFHPRRQRWERHFAWNGAILEGRTRTARDHPRVGDQRFRCSRVSCGADGRRGAVLIRPDGQPQF